jgi:hypothetical protein
MKFALQQRTNERARSFVVVDQKDAWLFNHGHCGMRVFYNTRRCVFPAVVREGLPGQPIER